MTPNPARPARGFWGTCRVYFRRFRIAVWLCVLLLLGGLIYLNQVGLPGVIKEPLLEKLRARGLDLQFSRLRLRWYQGIVAENVHFGRPDDPAGAELELGEVQVLLNFKALTHLRLQVDQLVLSQGHLLVPLPGTAAPERQLRVDDIQTRLRFLPDDQWALDNFRANFGGARIQLFGLVTNASSVGDWEFFHGQRTEPAASRAWQRRLQKVAEALDEIRFPSPPELRLNVRGDARDLQSFTVRLAVGAAGAETPWGTLAAGRFTVRLLPADTNGNTRADISLEAASAQTRWATVTNLHLDVVLTSAETQTNLVGGELKLSAARAHTRWASATNAVFSATWVHAITNPVPLSGDGRFECEEARTKWGSAQRVEVAGTLVRPPAGELPGGDESWGWWTNYQPYALAWHCRLARVHAQDLLSEAIACAGSWRAPQLIVTNLDVRLPAGGVSAQADLSVESRRLRADVTSDLDPHQIESLLPEAARRWLAQLAWTSPPRVAARGEVVLPAWTNSRPDWRGEVQPTLALAGEFSLADAAFRQVQVKSAHSQFFYSNQCWHLPDLALETPGGPVRAEHKADDRTRDFYWHINSSADLRAFYPLLTQEAQRGLELVSLMNPPVIDCQFWGRSREPERTGFTGHLALTNFSFRGQPADWLETSVDYTNRVLQIYHPRVQRGAQQASADGLTADFNAQLVYLTNGVSSFDPMAIANAIGPKIGQSIEPYHFDTPPAARVYGIIPMHGEEGADLHFLLEGGPFSWWKFHLPHIAGHVHWAGLRLFLQDMRMDLYDGKAAGSAEFSFLPPKQGTDFKFTLTTTNTLLHELMTDLSPGTNHLEGWVSGSVTITQANTKSWTTVFGYGNAELRDGLLWDIPIFGIFSPVLNGIAPGLGNFRAGEGTSTFTITDGVIHSTDLEIRSAAVRLRYRGTVDFESRLKARVEAELLRDVWLVGPIVSTVLWPVTKMFEYRVTGTLSDPKLDPVYIVPKLVLMPFRPLRTIKNLLSPDSATRTNAPPVFRDLPPEKK
ncbi:MAG TPA: AsmA-like C-terminal region-containing protein [Verrucomicrobiae bacterium]